MIAVNLGRPACADAGAHIVMAEIERAPAVYQNHILEGAAIKAVIIKPDSATFKVFANMFHGTPPESKLREGSLA